MSLATATAEAQRLKAIMTKHDVVCSIELQAGRPWSGDPYYSRKYALIHHHTAGPRTGTTPSLSVCKRGRGGNLPLPGPLCNGYGGRDHIYRIITMGLANHPGLGGPLTLSGFTIPKDSARISTWGTEWEHDGVSTWAPEMISFMGRASAALTEWLAVPIERNVEHKTWAPRRKTDRSPHFSSSGSVAQADIRLWGGLNANGKPLKAAGKPPAAPPPVKRPPANVKPVPLIVDGDWGPATWRRTQMLVKVPQTGNSNASTRRAVQHFLGVGADGVWGPITIKALQRRAGLTGRSVDGDLGPVTTRAWQRFLNHTIS